MRARRVDLQASLQALTDGELDRFRDAAVFEPETLPPWAASFALKTVLQYGKLEAHDRAERERERKRAEWLASMSLVLVKTVDELRVLVDRCMATKSFVLDTETKPRAGSALDTRQLPDGSTRNALAGVVLGPAVNEGFYIPVGHMLPDGTLDPRNLPALETGLEIRRLCEATQRQPGPKALLWNASFDFATLAPIIGFDCWRHDSYEDGQLAFFNRDTTRRYPSLKDVTRELLALDPLDITDVVPNIDLGYGGASLDDPKTTQYAALDGITTRLVMRHRECQPRHFPSYELDKQVLPVLSEIERYGIGVDIHAARELEGRLRDRIQVEETELLEMVPGFDLSAPSGVRDYLFGPPPGLGLPPPLRTSKGTCSVAKNALRMLREQQSLPAINLLDGINLDRKLLQYISKVASSSDDVVRPSLSLVSARTARIIASGGKPEHGYTSLPLQQIPRHADVDDEWGRWTAERYTWVDIRRLVCGRSPLRSLISSDFKEQEYRIGANMSGEQRWIALMLAGESMHTRLAEVAFDIVFDEHNAEHRRLRGLAKTTNFTLLFGGSVHALVSRGMKRELAQRLFDTYIASSPMWQAYVDRRTRDGFRCGFTTNAFGRPLSLRGSFDSELRRRCANYGIQATGGDILRHAIIGVRTAFVERDWWHSCRARIILPIHDELLTECDTNIVHEVASVVKQVMEGIVPRHFPQWVVTIPVTQVIGASWSK